MISCFSHQAHSVLGSLLFHFGCKAEAEENFWSPYPPHVRTRLTRPGDGGRICITRSSLHIGPPLTLIFPHIEGGPQSATAVIKSRDDARLGCTGDAGLAITTIRRLPLQLRSTHAAEMVILSIRLGKIDIGVWIFARHSQNPSSGRAVSTKLITIPRKPAMKSRRANRDMRQRSASSRHLTMTYMLAIQCSSGG